MNYLSNITYYNNDRIAAWSGWDKMNTLDFGKILRDLRERSGMSQKQLADRIGVSKASVSQYELHERLPSADVLANAASLFRVSTDYLLGLDKIKRADLTGLGDDDIKYVESLIELFRMKNQK